MTQYLCDCFIDARPTLASSIVHVIEIGIKVLLYILVIVARTATQVAETSSDWLSAQRKTAPRALSEVVKTDRCAKRRLHSECALSQPSPVAESDGDGTHVFDVELGVMLGVPDRLAMNSILL